MVGLSRRDPLAYCSTELRVSGIISITASGSSRSLYVEVLRNAMHDYCCGILGYVSTAIIRLSRACHPVPCKERVFRPGPRFFSASLSSGSPVRLWEPACRAAPGAFRDCPLAGRAGQNGNHVGGRGGGSCYSTSCQLTSAQARQVILKEILSTCYRVYTLL
jgi:hypothetical protein